MSGEGLDMNQLVSLKASRKDNFNGNLSGNKVGNSQLVSSNGLQTQSKVVQNERGEYVTIGEIEELPPTGNFKGSMA